MITNSPRPESEMPEPVNPALMEIQLESFGTPEPSNSEPQHTLDPLSVRKRQGNWALVVSPGREGRQPGYEIEHTSTIAFPMKSAVAGNQFLDSIRWMPQVHADKLCDLLRLIDFKGSSKPVIHLETMPAISMMEVLEKQKATTPKPEPVPETHGEKSAQIPQHHRKPTRKKLNESQVLLVKHYLSQGYTYQQTSNKTGVSAASVSAIAKKRAWVWLTPEYAAKHGIPSEPVSSESNHPTREFAKPDILPIPSSARRKLTPGLVLLAKCYLARGYAQKDVADLVNVSTTTIAAISQGLTWKWLNKHNAKSYGVRMATIPDKGPAYRQGLQAPAEVKTTSPRPRYIMSKLTEDQVRAIKSPQGRNTREEVHAIKYKVSVDTIRNIRAGRTWKWVD